MSESYLLNNYILKNKWRISLKTGERGGGGGGDGERKEKVTEQTNSILAICSLYLMM